VGAYAWGRSHGPTRLVPEAPLALALIQSLMTVNRTLSDWGQSTDGIPRPWSPNRSQSIWRLFSPFLLSPSLLKRRNVIRPRAYSMSSSLSSSMPILHPAWRKEPTWHSMHAPYKEVHFLSIPCWYILHIHMPLLLNHFPISYCWHGFPYGTCFQFYDGSKRDGE
jgi:hypothetical protein